MPGYQGHLVGGLVAGNIMLAVLTCAGVLHPTPYGAIEWLAVCLLGSLFPDIDIKSKGQKVFYWILLFLYAYLYMRRHLTMLGILSIVGITPMLVKHRGVFHKWWFIIALPFGLAFIAASYFPCYKGMIFFDTLFFVAGALSHLILDFGLKKTFRF